MQLKNWSNVISLFSISASLAGIASIRKAFAETEATKKALSNFTEHAGLVSVIIPAKNEQDIIAECVTAVAQQKKLELEIIVANDNSTDGTGHVLNGLAIEKVKTLEVRQPGRGWNGKTNAVWQGYQASSSESEWILFLDADTILVNENTLIGAINYAKTKNLDLVSIAGLPRWKGVWSPLIMPEVVKFYTIAHNNPMQPAAKDSVEAASAIGAFILVKRAAYEAIGGHEAVKSSIIEDIELAKTLRKHGFKTEQVNAPGFVETLWYESFGEIWEGVSKNLFLVANRKWSRVAFLLGFEWTYGLLPFLFVAGNRGGKIGKLLNYLAVILAIGLQNELNKGLKVPFLYSLFYPIAAVISSAITLNSAIKIQFRKAVTWKGRKITF